MHDDTASTAVLARAPCALDRDRANWACVTALAIGGFAIGTDTFVVAGILGDLAGDLDVPVGAAGLTVTVFAAAYLPAAGAAAVAAVPASKRGRALSLVLGGTSVAVVLGVPVGFLLAAMLSWRAAFALVAVLATGAVVALLLANVGTGTPIRSPVRERLRPMRSPAVIGALGVTLRSAWQAWWGPGGAGPPRTGTAVLGSPCSRWPC